MKPYQSSDWLVSENKAGNSKFWQLSIVYDGDKYYTQTSWYQVTATGGTSVTQHSEPYYAAPTNVGRANERDSKAQALFEFDAILKKQKDKGYRAKGETKQERPTPMLAHKYRDHANKVTYPCYVQPKLDGNRMLFNGEEGWSRGNKPMISEVIQHLQFDVGGLWLDGEIMLPDNVPLQLSMTAIKKFRPELSPNLLYHVYDLVDDTKSYREREAIINDLMDTCPENVRSVPTYVVHNEEELMYWHNVFIKQGYEGTMIRNPNVKYEIGKRSYSLLKLKEFFDEEFEIVDVLEGAGISKGMAIFKCKTPDGKLFDSTPQATHEQRKEWFSDRENLIGKWATVKHYGYTNDGIPSFNNTIGIRELGEF